MTHNVSVNKNNHSPISTKNLSIELLRFIFAFIVVMTHTHGLRPTTKNYPFVGGYIAVEFFLILSGYYIMKSVMEKDWDLKSPGKSSLIFTYQKFRPLYFYIVASVMIQYFIVGIIKGYTVYGFLKNFVF